MITIIMEAVAEAIEEMIQEMQPNAKIETGIVTGIETESLHHVETIEIQIVNEVIDVVLKVKAAAIAHHRLREEGHMTTIDDVTPDRLVHLEEAAQSSVAHELTDLEVMSSELPLVEKTVAASASTPRRERTRSQSSSSTRLSLIH